MKYFNLLYSIIESNALSSSVSNDLVNFIEVDKEILKQKNNWQNFIHGDIFIKKNSTSFYFFHEDKLFTIQFEKKENDEFDDEIVTLEGNPTTYDIQFGIIKFKEKNIVDYDAFFNKGFDKKVNFNEEVAHKNSTIFWNKIFNCIKTFNDNKTDIYYSFKGTTGKVHESDASNIQRNKAEYVFELFNKFLQINIKNALAPQATIDLQKYIAYSNTLKPEAFQKAINTKEFGEALDKINKEDKIKLLTIPYTVSDFEKYEKTLDRVIKENNNLKDFKDYSGYRSIKAILKIQEEIEILLNKDLFMSTVALQKKVESILYNLLSKYKLNDIDKMLIEKFFSKSLSFYDNIRFMGKLNRKTFEEIFKSSTDEALKKQNILIKIQNFDIELEKVLKNVPDSVFEDQDEFGLFVTNISYKDDLSFLKIKDLFYLSKEGLMKLGNTREKLYIKKLTGYGIPSENIRLISNVIFFKP